MSVTSHFLNPPVAWKKYIAMTQNTKNAARGAMQF